MIWKGVTQDNPRGRERVGGRVRDSAPICDIMADTLSVLYGTTENRNDKGPAASVRDLTQFNSRRNMYALTKGSKTNLWNPKIHQHCTHIILTHTALKQFVGESSLVERYKGEVVPNHKYRKIAESPTHNHNHTTPPFEYDTRTWIVSSKEGENRGNKGWI